MTTPTPASALVSVYSDLLRRPVEIPQVAATVLGTALPARDLSRPCAVLLSPHPDDECLTGGLPLRLAREQGWQIINIAMTLGSDEAQRPRRAREASMSCAFLGFDAVLPVEDGFSNLSLAARDEDPASWNTKVLRLAEMLAVLQPQAVFLPHEGDWNATHIGVNALALDALAALPQDFACSVCTTEYWHPHATPNVMVGLDADIVAALLSALACHAGEVARNSYDRRLTGYLSDNVRRGSELLGGKGAAAMAADFAMLYRLGQWRGGKLAYSALMRVVGADAELDLFN